MKKKLLFLLFLVLPCSIVLAQTEAGEKLAGGGVAVDLKSLKDESGGSTFDAGKRSSINFSPHFGYFVADNIAVGVGLDFSRDSSEDAAGIFKTTNTSFMIGPYGRYYHQSGLFGHVGFMYGSGKNVFESSGSTSESKDNICEWMAGPGFVAFVSNSVAVESMITYGSRVAVDSEFKDNKQKESGIMVRAGVTVFF